jgi:hypothetical protein
LLQSLFCDINDSLSPFARYYDIDIASLKINVDIILELLEIIDCLKVLKAQIQKDFGVNLVFVICDIFINPNHFVSSSWNSFIAFTKQKVIKNFLSWLQYNMVTRSFPAGGRRGAFVLLCLVLRLRWFFLFFDHNCFYFVLLILCFYGEVALVNFVIVWIPIQMSFLTNLFDHFVQSYQTSVGLMVLENTDDLEPLLVLVTKRSLALLTECRNFGNLTAAATFAQVFKF